MTNDDPLSAAKGCINAVLIGILLWAAVVSLGVAFAGSKDDFKAPPPLPKQQRSCLKVYRFPESCVHIEPEILRRNNIHPNQVVSPRTIMKLYEQNQKLQDAKLR